MQPCVNISPYRVILSSTSIIYVWSLPLLAYCGFAEKGSESISAFIANPPATGAMAAVSFIPLTLMWEYQDDVLRNKIKDATIQKLLYSSLSVFEFCYGAFLVCTENYAPPWLHTTTVVLFGSSFAIHGIVTIRTIDTSKCAKATLLIGIISFISLLFVKGMWFWAVECIGITSMMMYTPIQLYTYSCPKDTHEIIM